MPLYELVLVTRICEPLKLKTLLKGVSNVILTEGGVVRGFTNLGDRVLTKTLNSDDGKKGYNLGRFIQVSLFLLLKWDGPSVL